MAETKITSTWGYRVGEDGTVENRIFHLEGKEKLPAGWVDSPAKLKIKAK